MGMDVYGKNPTSEVGKYFRNNVWWWRPLADYIQEIAPEITKACTHWHSNDGDGLDKKGALALAEKLKEEVNSGRTMLYEKRYTGAQELTPNISCDLCEGTGTRKPIPQRGAGNLLEGGLKCNGCGGEGIVRPNSTFYPFKENNVKEFISFLENCGGFEIW